MQRTKHVVDADVEAIVGVLGIKVKHEIVGWCCGVVLHTPVMLVHNVFGPF
jgi:hypothetical protein